VVSFIIKGDVSGSVEAVVDSLSAIGNAEVSARILRHGVGPPSEFDIQHAADAQGHIVNFNTAIPAHVSKLAEEKGVKIYDSNIIYRTVEMVRDLLSEKLPPSVTQKVTGEIEIAAVFEIGLGGKKKMKVAGSKVRNGVVERGNRARVLRGNTVVHDGKSTNPFIHLARTPTNAKQASSTTSRTRRRTSSPCAKTPSAVFPLLAGRTSRSAIRSSVTRRRRRSGLCKNLRMCIDSVGRSVYTTGIRGVSV